MKKLYSSLATTALTIGFTSALALPAAHADVALVASATGSGCWAEKVTGPGNYIPGKDWDWVRLHCSSITGAKYARGKIVCNNYPDRYTSWLLSGETGESGGCPFGSGTVTVEYKW